MHRIDTDTAQADKFGVGKNGFTEGNPQTGELATALSGPFFDALQEEIAGVIEGAGITLSKSNNYQLWAALQSYFAKLNSPGFTGTPTAPTAASGNNSTQIATTAFVRSITDLLAPLASPVFTGNPTAPTPMAGDNDTSIATTAFVQTAINSAINGALVGMPLPWPLSTPPTGWLKCNGQSFNTSTYPLLAIAYPGGVLPDLRGEFIRGWDDGRGIDSGRTLLSDQQATIVAGNSGNAAIANIDTANSSRSAIGWESVSSISGVAMTQAAASPVTVNSVNLGYVRPRNMAFNYIVRAA
ncbi:tail fiber protein [Dickeya ananatis]